MKTSCQWHQRGEKSEAKTGFSHKIKQFSLHPNIKFYQISNVDIVTNYKRKMALNFFLSFD
jgi:hypothetical protein